MKQRNNETKKINSYRICQYAYNSVAHREKILAGPLSKQSPSDGLSLFSSLPDLSDLQFNATGVCVSEKGSELKVS